MPLQVSQPMPHVHYATQPNSNNATMQMVMGPPVPHIGAPPQVMQHYPRRNESRRNESHSNASSLINRSGSITISLALALGGICLSIFSLWQTVEAFLGVTFVGSSWLKVGLVLMGLLYIVGFFIGLWSILSAVLNAMPNYSPAQSNTNSKMRFIIMFRRISIMGNLAAFVLFVMLMVLISVSIGYWEIFLVLTCYGCCFVCIFSTLLHEIMRIKTLTRSQSVPETTDASSQGPGAAASSSENRTTSPTMQHNQNNSDWMDELPPSWERKLDPITGRYFYVDHINRRTTWVHPALDEDVMAGMAQYGAGSATRPSGNFYRQSENPDSKGDSSYSTVYTVVNTPPMEEFAPSTHDHVHPHTYAYRGNLGDDDDFHPQGQ